MDGGSAAAPAHKEANDTSDATTQAESTSLTHQVREILCERRPIDAPPQFLVAWVGYGSNRNTLGRTIPDRLFSPRCVASAASEDGGRSARPGTQPPRAPKVKAQKMKPRPTSPIEGAPPAAAEEGRATRTQGMR